MGKATQYSLDVSGFTKEIKTLAVCYDHRIRNKVTQPSTEQQPTHQANEGGRVQHMGGLTEEERTDLYHRGDFY
jgi:hypothetical protein